MKTPSHFRLFGKTWRIEWEELRKSFGRCYYKKLYIKVDPQHPLEHQQDTLGHEMGHAIDLELDLGMSEKQIRRFSTAWLGLMKDNPAVMQFMLRKE